MDAATFYLICFVVGFTLSLISFVSGFSHWHLPHGFHHAASPGHVGGHAHVHAHGSLVKGVRGTAADTVSPVNFMTLMAFLAWFGGTGYLLTRYSRFWYLLALGISSVSGLAGASVVFLFLVKVLMRHESALDPADYELVGAVGTISSSICQGGTGEIIFEQEGVRRTSGARSEDGAALPSGTEVVITRYDQGIAYVRRWEEFTK